jgi:hypothetical protein
MREAYVEVVLEKLRKKHPDEALQVMSDNGFQLTARDFREFIRSSGMNRVSVSRYYPRGKGKKAKKASVICEQYPLMMPKRLSRIS